MLQLEQIGTAFRSTRHGFTAVYQCQCGIKFATDPVRVRSGKTKSCGCFRSRVTAERNATHGRSKSRGYRIWNQMIQRCTNEKHISYQWYGAVGVSVCDSWKTFDAFYNDMGDPPKGMSIDRIEVSGQYSAENCRWATMKEQQRNRRNNVRLTIDGQGKTISEWAESSGAAKEATIRKRVVMGWDHRSAVFGVK